MYVDAWYVIKNYVGAIINYNVIIKYRFVYISRDFLYLTKWCPKYIQKTSHQC